MASGEEIIWAWGNKCNTLHILQSEVFEPSLCGFTPKSNRRGVPTWKVPISVTDVISNPYHNFTKCRKCLDIINEPDTIKEEGISL